MSQDHEGWLQILYGLTDYGRRDRQLTDPEDVTDDDLVSLARRVAPFNTAHLLNNPDGDMLNELRDAYEEGREPELLDFDLVLHELNRLGIAAHVENSSGGAATLYAGPYRHDPDGRYQRAVSLGPGSFYGRNNTEPAGYLDQLGYGTYDHSSDLDGLTTPTRVAEAIARLVAVGLIDSELAA